MDSSREPVEAVKGISRSRRATFAAQACQACRSRKTRCDEQRPRCSLCQTLNSDCSYREPVPMKKDMTVVHILNTLASLENKFDNLAALQGGHSLPNQARDTLSTHVFSPFLEEILQADTRPDHDLPSKLRLPYRHLTAPHKVVLWPSIYAYLTTSGMQTASDLRCILQEGTPWFVKQEIKKHPCPLPTVPGIPSCQLDDQFQEEHHSTRHAFPTLTVNQVHEYTDAYFDTFNAICPILDYDYFKNEVVERLLREGYADCDQQGVVALLVYALGQLAIEGVSGRPISHLNGTPSGFRGGTAESPPGLGIFNEARRRLGFVVGMCTLEDVQIMLLRATYYEANCWHLQFWRCTVAASMSIQVLLRCQETDWQSQDGEMIKRAYWVCILSEDFYHLDLDLPQTGIDALEDEIPFPFMHEAGGKRSGFEERSHFQYHFLAMIALGRLIRRINTIIHDTTSVQVESSKHYGGPPVHLIREMARQLDSWRSLLPPPLQWSDNDMLDYPDSNLTRRSPNERLFTAGQGSAPISHTDNFDVVTAQLRTRFYYARFMIFRPFVYKSLHFPELMTDEDVDCCTLAIQSCCLWPTSMAPPTTKKRLIPHLFSWTQNFMGILLILGMTRENGMLRQICDERVNPGDLQRTTVLMLEWMRDVKQIDGVAEWSWRILEPMFDGPLLL